MDKLLAVYGTLKKGHGNHHYMGNSQLLGEHRTEPNFTMRSMGGFPAVSLNGQTSIHVEVYKVNDKQTLSHINSLEGYRGVKDDPNNWYDVHSIETPYGEADLYYFKDEPTHLPIVESGSW